MNDLSTLLTGATIFFGVVIFIIMARKPNLFWTMLIIIAIGTAGLMIQGYALVDEILAGFLVLGILCAILVGTFHFYEYKEGYLGQLHEFVFNTMIVYMIIQSIRGLLLWHDIRIIRWVFFYGLLGLISWLISKRVTPVLSLKKILIIVTASAISYFSLYLFYGIFAEMFRNISRYDMQGVEWTGSAYAVFPLIIAMPSALYILMSYRTKYFQIFGTFSILIGIIVAFYYDSRISLLVILALISITFHRIIVNKYIMAVFIFTLFTGLYAGINNSELIFDKINAYSTALSDSVNALWNPRESDLDRNLHFRSSFYAIGENITTLFFGYGIHSSHFVLRPYLQDLYSQYLPGIIIGETVRTEAFTAILVDTGLVGMFLLTLNFVILILRILKKKNNLFRPILIATVVMTFLWTFVSNVQDVILFYLMVMPSGIIYQMSRYKAQIITKS